jgi:predicted tellurium resistance membrane protein TerC
MEWLQFNWLFQPEAWVALITLVVLELVLGVDNVIFISILAETLPVSQRDRARVTGISLAVLTRILLLLSISWIISLEEPLFFLPWFGEDLGISGHDLILLAGGLFLLWKSVHEIHEKLEGVEGHASAKVHAAFWSVIIQIMLLDIVFSLDSVITAVGMANELMIMIIAVILAAVVMIFASGAIAKFVEAHPTIKMLALSFLLLIGFSPSLWRACTSTFRKDTFTLLWVSQSLLKCSTCVCRHGQKNPSPCEKHMWQSTLIRRSFREACAAPPKAGTKNDRTRFKRELAEAGSRFFVTP